MSQRTWKRPAAALAAVAAITGVAAACVFVWNGNGSDDSFSNPANWRDMIMPCPVGFPKRLEDTARFPWNPAGVWAVDLVGGNIGDTTIEGSVAFNFDELGQSIILQTTKFTMAPTDGDVEVTVSGDAEIKVP